MLFKNKILFIILAMLASINAHAALKGSYVGGQLGFGKTHQDLLTTSSSPDFITSGSSGKNTGIAGRMYGGFLFNRYFGLEGGYTKFSETKTRSYTTQLNTMTGGILTTQASGKVKTFAVDVVGKGIIPFNNGFNLYGKMGVAYLRGVGNTYYSMQEPGFIDSSIRVNNGATRIFPTYGVGAGYELTHHVSTDVSWNRIQKVGNSPELKSTDLVSVGFSYNFG